MCQQKIVVDLCSKRYNLIDLLMFMFFQMGAEEQDRFLREFEENGEHFIGEVKIITE